MKKIIPIIIFLMILIVFTSILSGCSTKAEIIEKDNVKIVYFENKSKIEQIQADLIDVQRERNVCKEVLKLKSNIPAPKPSSKIKIIEMNDGIRIIYDKEKCRFIGYETDTSIDSTQSMIPTFDYYNKVFVCEPESQREINVGDVVVFRVDEKFRQMYNATYMIHRVVKKSYDSQGLYFETRADNNYHYDYSYLEDNIIIYFADYQKVRFEDILYKEERLW